MAKSETKQRKNIFKDMKTYWHTPPEGRFVPYKEYFSVFGAVGGDYTLKYLQSFLTFGTSCYLIAYYYEIPILTFSAINVFFLASTYFWNILSMGVDANLGFLPPKIEKKYNAVYLSLTLLGLLMLIFDLSVILPDNLAQFLDTRWKGLNSFSIFKIFGAHIFTNAWSGFRNIIIRKKLLKKHGRYKIFAYANVIQCLIVVILICELPLYKLPLTDRVWTLYLLFQLYTIFNYVGFAHNVAYNISTDMHERLLIRSFPVKISHLVENIISALIPTIAGVFFIDGIKDIGTFRYLIPIAFILSSGVMFIGLRNIKERIPMPPVETREYLSFWDCVAGVFKNKYQWIIQIYNLCNALGNGMLDMKRVLLIYTWRETGLFFSVAETVLKLSSNPGQFLAPWIRKRFQYRTLIIFKSLLQALESAVYILAILFIGDSFLCGLAIFIAMFVVNIFVSAVGIAQDEASLRVKDYQMYISGERLEEYQKIINWFVTPVTTLISIIIPLMFYRVGFTSDWDVLYMDDVRVKCMVIGLGFDLAGYLLMTLPYIFFWDYDDDKYNHIISVLRQREADGKKAQEQAEELKEVQ